MITPPCTTLVAATPDTPTRGNPNSSESPVRIVELFPCGNSDELDSFYDVKQQDKVTETVLSNVEVLEVLIASIEDKVDTIENKVFNLEKNIMENVTTMNRIIMIIKIALFVHLVFLLPLIFVAYRNGQGIKHTRVGERHCVSGFQGCYDILQQ